MTKLAQLIAKFEGFGRPGAIPTVRHNPGDLRHSKHSEHPKGPDDIGTIDTDAHGWEDLDRQLERYAQRGLTLEQFIDIYAPSSENDTSGYCRFLRTNLGVDPHTPLSKVLEIKAPEPEIEA